MRIAVNTRLLYEGKMEGVGWFTYEVLKRMVEQHPEDQFLFLFDRPYDEQFVFGGNVETRVLSPPARHPILWYIWFEISVKRALSKWKPDVFFSPDGYASLSTYIPQAIVTHDLAFIDYPQYIPKWVAAYYRFFWPKYIEKAQRVITVSNYVKSDIHHQYGTPLSKIDVACNGVREIFKPLDLDLKNSVQKKFAGGKPYLVYVGAIHPRKNVEHLLKAYEHYRSTSEDALSLVFAGRLAWDNDDFVQAVESSNYASDIFITGYLDSEDLSQVLAGAEISLYLSYSEGFGIPLLESMKAEVPLIISDRTSLPEVAGEAALIVAPEDILGITEAITQLRTDKELRASLIQKGILQLEKFSWEKAAQICYQSLVTISNS